MAQYISKIVGEKTTLGVLLTKNGISLTGLSPTLEIRRNSDGRYFDFSVSAAPYWKTTGGQREKILTEKVWLSGYYTWVFDHALYDNLPNEYTAIYRNDLPYRMVDMEIVSYSVDPNIDLSLIRKLLANKQTIELLSTDHYQHTVYDDNKTDEVYKADITMTDGITEIRDPL